jgi:hypothetical protein
MDISVTLKPAFGSTQESFVMTLKGDINHYCVLSFDPKTLPETFMAYLKNGCAELRSYHILCNDSSVCLNRSPKTDYLLLGINEVERLLCFDEEGDFHWMKHNEASYRNARHFWLETTDGITEVRWS